MNIREERLQKTKKIKFVLREKEKLACIEKVRSLEELVIWGGRGGVKNILDGRLQENVKEYVKKSN